MQRTIYLPNKQMTLSMKLLVLTQYFITAISAHPMLKSITGSFQVIVPTISLAISLLMGLLINDYDPIQQTVSQMVHYPYGWLLTTDFFVVSVWLFILAARFCFSYAGRNTTRFSGFVLLLNALGFFLIALFPTDMEGTAKNLTGIIHVYTARSVSILFPVACTFLLPQLFRDKTHRGLAVYTTITIIIGFILVLMCALVMFNEVDMLGLFERLLIANALVWGIVVNLRLFTVMPVPKTR